jgi:hypothetical protein
MAEMVAGERRTTSAVRGVVRGRPPPQVRSERRAMTIYLPTHRMYPAIDRYEPIAGQEKITTVCIRQVLADSEHLP